MKRPNRPWHKRQAPRGRALRLLALLCVALMIGVAGGSVAQESDADAKKATEELFEAAEAGNLAGVQASITAGGNMNAVDYRGLTPADVAADRGHFNVVHFLLSVRNVRRTLDGSAPSTVPPLAAATALPSLLATPPAPAPPPGVPRSAPSLPVLSAPLSANPPPQPIGPQGQPNPFDPSTIALGSTLTVVAEPAPIPIPTPRPIPTPQPTLGAVVAEVEAPAQPTLGMAMEMEAPLQPPLGAVVAETPPTPAPVEKAETPPPPASVAKAETPPPTPEPVAKSVTPPPPPPAPVIAEIPAPPAPAPVEKAEMPPPARPILGMTVGERQEPLSTPLPPPPDVVAMAEAAPAAEEKPSEPKPAAEKPPVAATPPSSAATTAAEEKPSEPEPAAEKPPVAATPQSSAATKAAEEKPEESENLFAALGRLLKAASAEDEQAAAQETEQVAKATKEPARAKPNPATPLPLVSLPPISLPANHLTGRTLAIGASGTLGTAAPTNGKGRSCVSRRSGAMTLCVEAVTWPAEMEKIFSVKSLIYDGAKAIVRYDKGKATRFHVLFPTDSFDAVVAHFTRRFGPATRTGTPLIEALGPIGQKNHTAAWVNLDPATKAVSALEIRAIDDIRGSLPDTRHGVVILIPGRAAPILPRRALLQLMMRKAGA